MKTSSPFNPKQNQSSFDDMIDEVNKKLSAFATGVKKNLSQEKLSQM